MWRCVACRRLVPLEDRGIDMGPLCYCLGCLAVAEEDGQPVTRERALELIKQAIRTWPRGDGPLPERVADSEAQRAPSGVCISCRFETLPDDVALAHGDGRVVCARCFYRATESERPMPKPLRLQIQAALAAAEG